MRRSFRDHEKVKQVSRDEVDDPSVFPDSEDVESVHKKEMK